jgi:class 3 adenylate cyclase
MEITAMTPNPASEVSGSGRPSEKHTKSQRIALFFAGVGAAQSFSNLGYLEGMNAVKEGCDLILATVSQRGGRVIKSSEDSITACFADPAESLKAAIDIQRNAVENRDKHMVLNIRIAIHFGDGLTEEGDLSRDMAAFAANANTIAKARHIYVSKEVLDNIDRKSVV